MKTLKRLSLSAYSLEQTAVIVKKQLKYMRRLKENKGYFNKFVCLDSSQLQLAFSGGKNVLCF